MTLKAAIIGGSGYVGGELARLLLAHPAIELAQITSERLMGRPIGGTHPNLRGQTRLQFVSISKVEPCDVLFLALSHGEAAKQIARFAERAPRIIDCSADFRLNDSASYARWYGEPHPAPEWLPRFVYGLPEANRSAIQGASYVSGVGCNATVANLALLPLVQAGLVEPQSNVVVDVKVGSSEGGAQSSQSSHHPERSGIVRSFAPTGHRHTAEIELMTGLQQIHLSISSVELVRGALATAHIFPPEAARATLTEKDLWQHYRATYGSEPFVRIIRERQGLHRLPEPKLLSGSNFADVGFDLDAERGRIVSIAAIDNLMKGAAGSAVQCMNLMCGFDERSGLEFPGLHPV